MQSHSKVLGVRRQHMGFVGTRPHPQAFCWSFVSCKGEGVEVRGERREPRGSEVPVGDRMEKYAGEAWPQRRDLYGNRN